MKATNVGTIKQQESKIAVYPTYPTPIGPLGFVSLFSIHLDVCQMQQRHQGALKKRLVLSEPFEQTLSALVQIVPYRGSRCAPNQKQLFRQRQLYVHPDGIAERTRLPDAKHLLEQNPVVQDIPSELHLVRSFHVRSHGGRSNGEVDPNNSHTAVQETLRNRHKVRHLLNCRRT